MRFWDSSALVPLFVQERHSTSAEALVGDDPEMVVWWASHAECASAVHRLRREQMLSASDTARMLADIGACLEAAAVVLPSDALRTGALRLLATHPLRAADALQLAAALLWAGGAPGACDFVSLDERLREAALLEGLHVLPAG